MTSMVATCSVEKGSIDESISTCRFAQRVALIKNDATLNEELDPKLVRNRSPIPSTSIHHDREGGFHAVCVYCVSLTVCLAQCLLDPILSRWWLA